MSENQKTKQPLDPVAANASQRDRLHAATAIQSSVKPEDYPEADRREQVASMGPPIDKRKGAPKRS